MGWLADLFSSQRARKGQAMVSTHDAFSLPTASPAHPDAFNPDILHTPEPTMSPSVYTYPPQGPGSYGYVPTSAGLSRPSGAILPTHMDTLHTPLSPHSAPAYPPLSKTWARIRAWLSREYPELGDTLNYGILPQDLADLELQFGFALPQVVRESYLQCDGQEAESAAGCNEGLFFGLTLLPLEDVLEEWRFWREVDADPATGGNERLRLVMQSVPPGWVRREYSQRGWVPLIADRVGNYVGVDLNPAEGGQVGQVIVFGRDFDTKVVLWRGDGVAGWAKWLAGFVEDLESGEGFELGPAEASDDSEDELGYEGYFYDGKGRGQGDGGGDTGGVGGLRLTGEHKGWNVMEAWADRSLRKWHQAGVIADVSLLPPEENLKGKGTDTVGLGVMDVNHGTGAEIPIPVLADVDEPIPPPASVGINGKRISAQNIPTISVTKPPAPRPVDLPTVQDIAEEDTSPHSSFDEEGGDLEAGRGPGLPSQDQQTSTPTSPRQPPKHITPVSHAAASAAGLSLADVVSPGADATTPLVREMSDPVNYEPVVMPADLLLADSVRGSLETKLIQPLESGPVSPVAIAVDQPLTESPKLVDAEFVIESKKDSEDEEEEEEEDEDGEEEVEEEEKKDEEEEEVPTTTVRLIGGGGTSGVVPLELQSSEDSETVHVESAAEVQKQKDAEADASSVKSVDSSSSPKKQHQTQASQQGHKKTKSSGLAGLKRFSQFGKKGSAGSAKEVSKEG